MADKRPMITLLTDFGEADYFVPAMKGAIYAVNREVDIIDLTHQIAPHDIYSGAFTLMCCYQEFPKWTIHVAVVDPGVGSQRRPLLVMTDEYYFIGPDNGIFSYIYQRENVNRVVHLTETHYFRWKISNTFHGRDIFAPAAAYVSKAVDWRRMGEEVTDYVKFNTPTPVVSGKQIRGHVIHVDRFGNLITNITENELTDEFLRANARVRVGKFEAQRILTHYVEATTNELFAYFGSTGFLELAVSKQSAARLTEARRGIEVEVMVP
ncbi:MAG: SAM-dependent chlorinase/fluorinase [Acidobacteriota bacterium]